MGFRGVDKMLSDILRKIQREDGESGQKFPVGFLALSCDFLTLCQPLYERHWLIFLSACGVGTISTPLSQTGKLRHREAKGFYRFSQQVQRSWSLDTWSLTLGPGLLVTTPQGRINLIFKIVCVVRKAVFISIYSWFLYRLSKDCCSERWEELSWGEKGEREGKCLQVLGLLGGPGGMSLHHFFFLLLESCHKGRPGPQAGRQWALALATFVDWM